MDKVTEIVETVCRHTKNQEELDARVPHLVIALQLHGYTAKPGTIKRKGSAFELVGWEISERSLGPQRGRSIPT